MKWVIGFALCYLALRSTPFHGQDTVPDSVVCLDITVSENYIHKHNPQIGGYYVLYEDGYESFSPADAFESGYSLI
jgi:hypothetical protein